MSDDDLNQIRPKSVPLSHIQDTPARVEQRRPLRMVIWLIAAIAGVLLLVAVFVVLPDLIEPVHNSPGQPTPAPATTQTPNSPAADDKAPAPFAALQREQARAQAQKKLSEFVELQLTLEETMQVGTWGEAQLDAAKALATEGDEEFLRENYQAALNAYDAAAIALAALIETGGTMLDTALAEGFIALDNADQVMAQAQFELALTLDPNNAAAADGLRRSALLPQVIVLMRQGKNYELAGDTEAALQTYQKVAQIDPLTNGLNDALAAARDGVTADQIREHLSAGFSALETKRFELARKSFQAVLQLDPGNSVASGGLEQVAQRTDLTQIEQLRESATAAEAAERWQQAIAEYDRVLALDPNIQFAKDGRLRAGDQYRAQVALANIIANPDKLSSPQLFDQAKEILARAQRLTPQGAALQAQTTQVSELILVYSTQVPVTLESDEATVVTLSTVGVLGSFSQKQLSLRPGAYTLIGSRNGYRDVRETLLVRPDMAPFVIRCTEKF